LLAAVLGPLVLALLGAGALAGVFFFYSRGIAAIDEDALRNHRPPQVTRVLARDGTLIGEIFSERRTVVPVQEIPTLVQDAFLAAEDAEFRHHEGMDVLGMVRALVVNVRAGEVRQGASTITQQVVKNFLLSPERTLERKVQELVLARRLEQVLTKDEILGLYLNEIYLGHGCYGVDEASRYYFGKSVRELDVGEAALLATLPKAPSAGSPYKVPEKAKARQQWVLKQMVEQGFVDAASVRGALDAPLPIRPDPESSRVVPGAEPFVDAAEEWLRREHGEELDRLGATVWTTVDPKVQGAAQKGLREHLQAMDVRHGWGHDIKPGKGATLAKLRAKSDEPLAVGAVHTVVIEEVVEDDRYGEPGFIATTQGQPVFVRVPPQSRYDEPDRTLREQFREDGLTVVRIVAPAAWREADGKDDPPAAGAVPEGHALAEIASGPEAAVVVIDVGTGAVRGMVGGFVSRRAGFNRVREARRQPGSTFKPFVYGAAIASRAYTVASLVDDSPEIYDKWRPTNFEADTYRGLIPLRLALAQSVNTIAIKLADAVGVPKVIEFARACGVDLDADPNLSLALGTAETTPLELARAYTTLARSGTRVEPYFVERVEIPGREVWVYEVVPTPAIDDDVAYVLTSMMTSVVEEGTGVAAKKLGPPVAAKTGTSAEHRDAWFAGFTTEHVAVSWVGFDTPKPLGKGETGGRAALPIWMAAMRAAEGQARGGAFLPPPSVVLREIDSRTGMLALLEPLLDPVDPSIVITPATPKEFLRTEPFLRGTEPTAVGASPDASADAVLDLYGAAGGDAADGEAGSAGAGAGPPAPLPPQPDAAGGGGAGTGADVDATGLYGEDPPPPEARDGAGAEAEDPDRLPSVGD
jgi:penicillin-binding protein 1A